MKADAPRWPRGCPLRILLCAVLATTLALPRATTAQSPYSSDEPRWASAGWTEDLAFAVANGMISGVLTGLVRALSDEGSFSEGFGAGLAGGAITYVGKRLTAQRFAGAGLVGRQVASFGGSLASNAGSGRGALDRLTFPVGLGRLYWDRSESRVVFRPDIVTLYYTAVGVASSRVGLDWPRTLSAGGPVFVTREGVTTLNDNAAGRAFGGVVVLDLNARLPLSDIAAHERVHVIQYDQQFAVWGEAAERGLVSMLGPPISDVLRRADLAIGLLPLAPFLAHLPRGSNPFEIEAEYLTAWGGS